MPRKMTMAMRDTSFRTMTEEHNLYWDYADAGFCRVVEDEAAGMARLLTPDEGDEYYSVKREVFDYGDLVEVPDDAVEDPAEYIEEILDEMMALQGGLTNEQSVGLRWARRQTTIVEHDE